MTEPSQPLLPPGTGPKLGRALLDLVGALLWFVMGLFAGGGETDVFGNGTAKEYFALIALAGALTVGVTFGLRMASIAVDRVPAWVPRVEVWHWIALLVWFGLAAATAQP